MTRKKTDAFTRRTQALEVLPNVGPKSARRMAYELLRHKREGAAELAAALQHALTAVQHCRLCNTFCEGELCAICADPARDGRRLMIVHLPADVAGMEAAHCHDGLYFVLMGQISPAQGMDLQHIAPMCWPSCSKTYPTASAAWRRVCRWAASWNTSTPARWRNPCMNGGW